MEEIAKPELEPLIWLTVDPTTFVGVMTIDEYSFIAEFVGEEIIDRTVLLTCGHSVRGSTLFMGVSVLGRVVSAELVEPGSFYLSGVSSKYLVELDDISVLYRGAHI